MILPFGKNKAELCRCNWTLETSGFECQVDVK